MDERRDDWRRGVDENLASLNAGQRIWERELATLRKLLGEIIDDLRGSISNETDGIIHRLREAEASVQMLKSIIDVDRIGESGLMGRVEALERRERTSETRLKIWIAVIGLLSALASAAVFNIDKIEASLNKQPKDPIDQAIDRARHPKPRYRHYVIREDGDSE